MQRLPLPRSRSPSRPRLPRAGNRRSPLAARALRLKMLVPGVSAVAHLPLMTRTLRPQQPHAANPASAPFQQLLRLRTTPFCLPLHRPHARNALLPNRSNPLKKLLQQKPLPALAAAPGARGRFPRISPPTRSLSLADLSPSACAKLPFACRYLRLFSFSRYLQVFSVFEN